jgi:hypothetical protein
MKTSSITPKLKEGESVDLSLYNPHQRTNIRLYGLECKDWTPAMISEYKHKWAKNSTPVIIRGRYTEAVQWCRVHLFNQTFNAVKYANPDDSHTIHFENPEDAMLFKLAFSG